MSLITYPLNNVMYSAEDAELFHATRTSGIFAENSFEISVNGSDNSVTIGPGIGWIKNGEFSGKVIALKETVTIDLDIPDSVYPRIDAVVIQFDSANNETNVVAKKGTASSSPIAPEVVQNENVYELHLLHARRNVGAPVVSFSDITDLRLNPAYCGLMADSVTNVNTNAINSQITELISELRSEIAGVRDGSAYWLKSEVVDIESGGTGATNSDQARANLGAVPTSRTINGKRLSSNITLSADDVEAVNLNKGTLLAQNTNMDNLTTPGNYYINGSALGQTILNLPYTNGASLIRVYEGGAGGQLVQEQIAGASEYCTRFVRRLSAGSSGWGTWNTPLRSVNGKRSEATNGAITLEAADVGAVNINRGTAVAANTDMNDLTTPGTYYIAEDVAQTVENLQYNRDLTIVDVRKMDDENILQIQYGILGGGFLFRRINVDNNAVSNWMGPPTTVNMVEPDEVGNILLTVANISGAVPDTRTINGRPLSSNITLSAGNFEIVKDINAYSGSAFTLLPSSSDPYVEILSCDLRKIHFANAWSLRIAIKAKKPITSATSVLKLPTVAIPTKNIALAGYSSGPHFSALINDSGNIRLLPMITGSGQSGFSGISENDTLHLSGFWFAD